ncbi:MAG: hypothetical protein KC649_03315 [Candidatus Omnitrophica bacterium]|nr:hypothetical protein [Candidatus Omnitrophota bacterium]
MTAPNSKTIVLGITASIAAYRACELITAFKKKNIRVIPVLTKDAAKFITPLTVHSLAAEPYIEDYFAAASNVKPIHIEIAKAADCILIAPASADFLAKMRAGFADELLSSVLLASDKPVLAAPAMNDVMYRHPATQENMDVLKKRGVKFIDPIEGRLVCTDHALGHIAENETIIKTALQTLGV